MRKIVVEKYNPQWRLEFEKAKTFFTKVLGKIPTNIEHVGSTSIFGLSAKPILDIDIIVEDKDISRQVIKKLEEYGYYHVGDYGIEGREVLKYKEDNPFINWMNHHLYICLKGTIAVRNHLLLKRHLSNNLDAVRKYSELKTELAKKFENDIDAYVDGKTKLIISMLEQEGMNKEELNSIEDVNILDSK